MLFFTTIVLFVLIVKSSTQQNVDCNSKQNCHECIQHFDCVWCINPTQNITLGRPVRCLNDDQDLSLKCHPNDLSKPKSSFQILKNKDISNVPYNVVQLQPQQIAIKLRKNEEFKFKFIYKQAEDYPVDLYYLMDLSQSMKVHKEKLALLGAKISKTMKKLTKNFRLGFGSFVDKPTLPYVNTAKKYESNSKEAEPYGFKNHLSLTDDWSRFNKEVSSAKISENIDSPEGGFDALMQAMVCKDVIQWRENARHLLVFSTDAISHMAGDGKLAGIVEPNDGKCHMKNNMYTGSLIYDYPSPSHLNYVARRNNINILFAISSGLNKQVDENYRYLSKIVENSNVAALDAQSNNVVKLIIESYNKIVDSVIMTSTAPKDIEIKFSSNCTNPIDNGCTNVHVGEPLEFTATIKATQCSKNNTHFIKIQPQALAEAITIELELQCDCDCERPGHTSFQLNSPACTQRGNLECGICNCQMGYSGERCECDRASIDTYNVTVCQSAPLAPVCSGFGVCKCGVCQCNQRQNPNEKISGKYCECNNYNCNRYQGKLCAGHGKCECGECTCDLGWTGMACECQNSNSTCIQPNTNSICSDHGSCQCGQCKCIVDENRYSGKYCEECTTCPSQRCEELKDCVECQVFHTGIYDKSECMLKCTAFETQIVSKFNDTYDIYSKKCRILDKKGCRLVFEYTYEDKNLIVRALKQKVCAGPPNILGWIGGVIGSIIIAGLIMLLVWKICTTLHDKREYAKFEEDRRRMMWGRGNNPLYKDPSKTFQNPSYGRRSMRLSS